MNEQTKSYKISDWLPISKKEVDAKGWEELDVILFSGDAYVDHPAFGPAIIGRILESAGLKVAIVPQPNWQDDLRDFKKLGKPRLFFGVTAGNMDSMVNHYTANKRLRSDDAYTAGNKSGRRPDYASIVYSKILKKLYPEVPVVLGGVEASLRRLSHYDYWADELKPSILAESKADLMIYGNGEKPLLELVDLLQKGVDFSSINTLRQTAFITSDEDLNHVPDKWGSINLYSHEQCLKDKINHAKNFKHIEHEANKMEAKRLVQKFENKNIVVNPAFQEVNSKELDSYYDLPFTRKPHPRYNGKGAIPAYEMIRHSVTIHRGCFGGCAFCTIVAHQGKFINSRSEKSVLKELKQITLMDDFKGQISDIGGPSANMYKMQGKDKAICANCSRPSCISPSVCNNLNSSHQPLIDLYRKSRKIPGIKKISIGSGVRYDMILGEKQHPSHQQYFEELFKYHVSGRLKVAPEHTSDRVLKIMRKPTFNLFYKLKEEFDKLNKKFGLKQQLIPYFISSHPGSEESDMRHLSEETKKLNFKLEQVQDFTPTPMTLATVIYYTGYHPFTLEKIYTAKTKEQKLKQREYFFWYKKGQASAKKDQFKKKNNTGGKQRHKRY